MNTEIRFRLGAAAVGAMVATLLLVSISYWLTEPQDWSFSRNRGSAKPPAKGSSSEVTPIAPSSAIVEPKPAGAQAENVSIPDSARLDSFGVRFERARIEPVAQVVRAVATVVTDETRISHVHARYSGWLEQLYVNTTGQSVRVGEPLAGIFSQDLYASQNEYLTMLGYADGGLASAALKAGRTRLELLGMTAAEIKQIERTRQARRLVTVVAPRAGVVLRRGVSLGTAIDPSTEIVTIADLSSVWVIAEIPETQSAGIKLGDTANLSFPASGLAAMTARVQFIYPTLTDRTRTVRARFVAPNTDGRLRPGLYGTAEFAPTRRDALTVSRDAVVDRGELQYVYVRAPSGVLEPRTVKLGSRLADRIEVTQGVSPEDDVVAAGVFLIDSESRLRASGSGVGHSGHGGSPVPTAPAPAPAPAPASASAPAVAPAATPAPASAPASTPAHSTHGK